MIGPKVTVSSLAFLLFACGNSPSRTDIGSTNSLGSAEAGASSGSLGGSSNGGSSGAGQSAGSSPGDNGGSSSSSAPGGGQGAAGTGSGSGSAPGSNGSTSGASSGTEGGTGDCGMRTGMRGQTFRTLMVDGASRTYYAYLPSSVGATTSAPMIFVMHGATQNANDMITITGYEPVADSEGIAIAFLDGENTNSMTSASTLDPWNVSDNSSTVCGAGDLANSATPKVDFDFLDAIKVDIAQDQCIDARHIFATGFSMGGYFTHHIGCDRTDIRAVGPASGGTIASLSACATGHVPIIIFHGTSDPLISSGCDDPNGTAQSGFPPSATLWAQKNGCQTTSQTIAENGTGGNDGQCYLYNGCPSDGQVELCTFTNMEHAWAGSTSCPGCIGTGNNYASATQLEWSFFKKYAW